MEFSTCPEVLVNDIEEGDNIVEKKMKKIWD
jgi:hypothetical protein